MNETETFPVCPLSSWQWLAPMPSPHCPGSVSAALAEVEEALETVEAFWAARRTESSRVRQFT